MRTFGLLTSLALALSQEGDETAYLLQTRTQQQKSADVDDCYVTGGCSTTAATEAPTTTTTEAPTTTTARPTRPATTTPRPTRPTRPTTTTTEAEVAPPPVGFVIDTPPGVPPVVHDDYCGASNVLQLTKPAGNNLGGMGPTKTIRKGWRYSDAPKELRYNKVTTTGTFPDKKDVHLVITASANYKTNNVNAYEFGTSGEDFIDKHNGGGESGRSDVMAIGSLAKGSYTFTFKFEDDEGEAVVIPYLPLTFFDLDGSTKADGGKSYEVVSTTDADGQELIVGSEVSHNCDDGECVAEGAKKEIKIPSNFGDPDPDTSKAAITFFFKGKSTFDITYTLNWPHRVFLFKGQCIKTN